MRNIKVVIEYDGTRFCGWQVQKNGITVQRVLQDAIEGLVGHEIRLTGSSRTDSGVHAKGMVANFFTDSNIPSEKFPAAINCRLPEDIVIVRAADVSPDFHSRYSCTGKRYSYLIMNRRAPSAIFRNYTAHVPDNLDITVMTAAMKYVMGTHDFSAFKASGSSVKDNVRTVRFIDISKDGDIIKIQIEADGFLYNMVRIIVGTLLEIGKCKIPPEAMEDIIESRDRKRAGKTAPPQGLYLECVYY